MPTIRPGSDLRSNYVEEADANELCRLIDEGLHAAAAGRTRPYDEAMKELREEFRNGKL